MTTIESTSPDPSPTPIGFWPRALARILDWFVLFVIGLVALVISAITAGMVQGATGWSALPFVQSLEKMTWVAWVGSTLVALCYHALVEGLGGSSLGKRIVGAEVVSESVAPCNLLQGARRSLAFLVDALFFGYIAADSMSNSPTKQRVGDKWAKTIVVKRKSLAASVRRSNLRFFAAFVLACVIGTLVQAATQFLSYAWLSRGA